MATTKTYKQSDAFNDGVSYFDVEELPDEVKSAPTARQSINDSHNVIVQAKALVVSDPHQYIAAADVLQNLRGAFKKLETERKGITDPMRAAVDKVMAFFKPHTEAIEQAADIVKGKMNAYDAEQKRIADEARRKAEAEAAAQRAEAERKARAEREAAEAKARAEREEAERQRRAQEEAKRREREARESAERAAREAEEAKRRGDAEAARKAREEADAQAAAARAEQERAAVAAKQAQKADAKADRVEAKAEDKANALEMQAASIVAPVIESEAPKVSGIARRMVWKYKVTKEAEIKREFLILDEAKIAKIVKAMGKDAEGMVGGIECWQENDLSARAK